MRNFTFIFAFLILVPCEQQANENIRRVLGQIRVPTGRRGARSARRRGARSRSHRPRPGAAPNMRDGPCTAVRQPTEQRVQAHHRGCDSALGPDILKLSRSGDTLNVHSL